MAPNGRLAAGPRCIAIVGPFQSGKTTLLEAILERTGAVSRAGRVANGDSVGDASAEARHDAPRPAAPALERRPVRCPPMYRSRSARSLRTVTSVNPDARKRSVSDGDWDSPISITSQPPGRRTRGLSAMILVATAVPSTPPSSASIGYHSRTSLGRVSTTLVGM